MTAETPLPAAVEPLQHEEGGRHHRFHLLMKKHLEQGIAYYSFCSVSWRSGGRVASGMGHCGVITAGNRPLVAYSLVDTRPPDFLKTWQF